PRLCAYRFRSFCLSHRKAGRVPRRNTPLEIREAHAPRDAGLSDEGAGGPADPPCPAVARHTRTRSRAPQAYGSSDPTAPAVPRATFAAHPSLRVRWGQYAPAGIDGDYFVLAVLAAVEIVARKGGAELHTAPAPGTWFSRRY